MSVQRATITTYAPALTGSVSRVTLVSQSVTGPTGSSGTGGDMMKADNLAGLTNLATARTNLGLGTAATTAASAYATAAQGATADTALQVGGTAVVGHIPTVTDDSPLTVEWAAPSGGAGGGGLPAQPQPAYADYGTPYVSVPGVATTSRIGAYSIPGDEYRLSPIVVFAPITITEARIGVESAGTAGTNCRIAIYEIDNADGKPASLVADLGVLSIASTGQKRLTGLSVPLAAGMYLVRVHNQSTASLTYWGGYSPWWSAGPLGNENFGLALTGGGLAYAAAEDPGSKPSSAYGAYVNTSLYVLAQFGWTVD